MKGISNLDPFWFGQSAPDHQVLELRHGHIKTRICIYSILLEPKVVSSMVLARSMEIYCMKYHMIIWYSLMPSVFPRNEKKFLYQINGSIVFLFSRNMVTYCGCLEGRVMQKDFWGNALWHTYPINFFSTCVFKFNPGLQKVLQSALTTPYLCVTLGMIEFRFD